MKVHYLRIVRRTFRALRHPKLRNNRWWKKITKPLFHRSLWMPCRDTVASGLAIGLFFSMMPLIPQSLFAAVLAMRAKVNVPFAMAACFISNPFTNVPFWYAQIHLGQWLIDFFSLPVPSFLAKATMSLPGVGAALCALVIAYVPINRHVGGWMFGSVALFGVATIVFGASTVFLLSLGALVVLGAADMISVYIRHLLVQLETPDAIRGRVSAVSAVFIGASNELGEFESGVTAAWWGVVRAVVIGGIASVAVAGLWTKLFPVLARMHTFPLPVERIDTP